MSWILNGANDLIDLWSAEAVVVGIIQIAQEIAHQQLHSVVVLNSIYPEDTLDL